MPPPAFPTPPEIVARLGGIGSEEVRAVLEELLNGDASAPVSLARLLLATDSLEEVETLLSGLVDGGEDGNPIAEMLALIRDHRPGCEAAAVILHEHPDLQGRPQPPREAIADCRRFFDRAVTLSEEASVAAYCLGDIAILDACTRETLALLDRWGVLEPDRVALDLGCGIGRFSAALGPRLRQVHGIDISPKMIAAARRRCAHLPNVRFSRSSGHDLSRFADASFDLVLAADSFPYIFQGGPDLVAIHFLEIARVLRPGGDFVLLNFSYRASRQADRRDVQRLCRTFGLHLAVPGAQPFRLWDAEAYHIRRGV
ncbi:MAG: class I SAM-dependent methyltransferase [Acidobacteriota bacterium]